MLAPLLFRATLLFTAFSSLVVAQGGFENPDGDLSDLSQTFTIGSVVSVSWYSGWNGYGNDPGYADLFLTSFESDSYNEIIISTYKQTSSKLNNFLPSTANRSTASGGSYNWRVSVPSDVLEQERGRFVFKWTRALSPPNYNAADTGQTLSPSRGFNIRAAGVSSSIASSSTLLASSFASGISSVPTPTSSSSPGNNNNNNNNNGPTPSNGSSTPIGAIVGGVIGGVVALAIIAFLLWKLRKMKKANANAAAQHYPPNSNPTQQHYNGAGNAHYDANHQQYTYPPPMTQESKHAAVNRSDYATPPQELPSSYAHPVEADGYQMRHGQ